MAIQTRGAAILRIIASLAAVGLLGLAGCSFDDDGDQPGGGAGTAASAGRNAAAGTNGASGSGASGDAGGSAGDAGDGAGGTSGGAGGSSSSSCGDAAGSGGGGAPLVQCSDLGSGSCSECIAEKCCDLAELCAVDAECACMAMCIGQQGLGGVDGCLGTCDVAGSPPGFADLANCLAPTCPDGDECSTPANFMPPPDVEPEGGSSNAGIGSGTLADCSFDAGLGYDPDGTVLQLQSADQGVCVRIERRNDGPGSLANTSFTLLDMRVGPPGEVVLIDNPSDVCWYSSHHNFNDWAHAWSGSRHYDVKMARTGHGAAPTYELHVFEQGPLDASSCAPAAEGSCPIGGVIALLPVNP